MRKRRSMPAPIAVLGAMAALVAPAAAAEHSIPELFAVVNSAVVEITAVQQVVAPQGERQQVRAGSLGSGFLIANDGRIMTAAHVVQVADEVSVRFVSGETVRAKVVASAPAADLALIQAESVPEGVTSARLGNSDTARVGDQVFVVGAPLGNSHSLTVGHISARRTPDQLFGGFEQVELLQTDAAINIGNSGGPMFNMNGEVIGVVSHILSSSGGSQGLGFVVTSNLAMRTLVDDPTPWSGLDGVLVQGEMARAFNVPQRMGILVEQVAAGSPAAALGIRPGTMTATIEGQNLTVGGDILLAINGILVGSPDFDRRIDSVIRSLSGDDRLTVRVLRAGEIVELSRLASSIGYAD
ncbi:MAG: trypsin-like peptidase domain-containing protein [Holophagae bacterium]